MTTPPWQLRTAIDAIVFDCDGTLSTIEGIDELANQNGVSTAVKTMTAEAMGKSGINLGLYKERLDLVRPRQKQVSELGKIYYEHLVPDTLEVIKILQSLNKSIYLISAGLYPAVIIFGELLGIPRDNIHAVNIQFDAEGNYINFDTQSPFAQRNGKRDAINQIKKQHPHLLFVGDGLNDLAALDLVTRFVGFGGAYFRQNIANLCQFYVSKLSMSPILPLALTKIEFAKLNADDKKIYEKGLDAIMKKEVIINL